MASFTEIVNRTSGLACTIITSRNCLVRDSPHERSRFENDSAAAGSLHDLVAGDQIDAVAGPGTDLGGTGKVPEGGEDPHLRAEEEAAKALPLPRAPDEGDARVDVARQHIARGRGHGVMREGEGL